MDAIPAREDPKRYVCHAFLDSAFVELDSGRYFEVSMQYPVLKMKNAEKRCFVRREVYDMLLTGKIHGGQ